MNKQKWLQMASTLGLMALAYTPLAPIAPYASQAIQEAELLPGASGADKLSHVINMIRTGIAATNAQAGRTIIDTQLSDAIIGSSINTAVGVINLVHQAHASTVVTSATAPVLVAQNAVGQTPTPAGASSVGTKS